MKYHSEKALQVAASEIS